MAEEMSDLSVYQAYLKNIRQSEVLQSEILVGAKEGEDPCSLLLKAAKAISLMTNSDVFCNEITKTIHAVYGQAFGEKGPIESELAAAEARLARLNEAMAVTEPGADWDRMKCAVRAHENAIARMKKQLEENK